MHKVYSSENLIKAESRQLRASPDVCKHSLDVSPTEAIHY